MLCHPIEKKMKNNNKNKHYPEISLEKGDNK